ncbi:MAG: hypothetical protein PHZ25_02255 [Candidatus Pacebacteria bacterium]|nr:hypothetical protein [Candidatus Paceibacterota bacterium]
MSEYLLVYGNFKNRIFQVAEVCLTTKKREELEEIGIKIPSLNGNTFSVKGEEKLVWKIMEEIKKEGVTIKTPEGSYSGIEAKEKFLEERGGMMVMQVLSWHS